MTVHRTNAGRSPGCRDRLRCLHPFWHSFTSRTPIRAARASALQQNWAQLRVIIHSPIGLDARLRSRATHPIRTMGQPTLSRSLKRTLGPCRAPSQHSRSSPRWNPADGQQASNQHEHRAHDTHHHPHRPFTCAEHPTGLASDQVSSRRLARPSRRRSRPVGVRPGSALRHVPAAGLTVYTAFGIARARTPGGAETVSGAPDRPCRNDRIHDPAYPVAGYCIGANAIVVVERLQTPAW
jgi:hypothetical protein